jgi:hypothetical protein
MKFRAFHADVETEEAELRLRKNKIPGSYLLRFSNTIPGSFVVSGVVQSGII